jgi:hypothetical protein
LAKLTNAHSWLGFIKAKARYLISSKAMANSKCNRLILFPDVPQCAEQNPADLPHPGFHMISNGNRGGAVFTKVCYIFVGPKDKADIWDHVANHVRQASQPCGLSCSPVKHQPKEELALRFGNGRPNLGG